MSVYSTDASAPPSPSITIDSRSGIPVPTSFGTSPAGTAYSEPTGRTQQTAPRRRRVRLARVIAAAQSLQDLEATDKAGCQSFISTCDTLLHARQQLGLIQKQRRTLLDQIASTTGVDNEAFRSEYYRQMRSDVEKREAMTGETDPRRPVPNAKLLSQWLKDTPDERSHWTSEQWASQTETLAEDIGRVAAKSEALHGEIDRLEKWLADAKASSAGSGSAGSMTIDQTSSAGQGSGPTINGDLAGLKMLSGHTVSPAPSSWSSQSQASLWPAGTGSSYYPSGYSGTATSAFHSLGGVTAVH